MRYIFIFTIILASNSSFGQTISYPSIKKTGINLGNFVPNGWLILDSAYGDLNSDGVSDAAVVIQQKDSIMKVDNDEDTLFTQPRILLILFKNSTGNLFYLAEQSNSFIMKHDNPSMDEPYIKTSITGGILKINFLLFYYNGTWYVTNASYKFRYQKGEFILAGADKFSFHRSTHEYEDYSYNFLTGKRRLEKGNDNNESKRIWWKTMKGLQPKTLKSFTEPFTWEVEPGIFL
ncbi:hypothetical protein [Foetidibacter luteolus]|uniref:hypothetical protein n=1 Tax=Foetidibacter luteolus TaxID=2608880 RepID=UPI00129B9170|nr:hypothetical protein [Foetidibacter luteolus]